MTHPRRRTAREIAEKSRKKSAQNMRVFLMIIIATAALVGVLMFRRGCGEQAARVFTNLDPPKESTPAEPRKN